MLMWTTLAAGLYILVSSLRLFHWLRSFPLLTWVGLPAATAWGWVLSPSLGYVGQGGPALHCNAQPITTVAIVASMPQATHHHLRGDLAALCVWNLAGGLPRISLVSYVVGGSGCCAHLMGPIIVWIGRFSMCGLSGPFGHVSVQPHERFGPSAPCSLVSRARSWQGSTCVVSCRHDHGPTDGCQHAAGSPPGVRPPPHVHGSAKCPAPSLPDRLCALTARPSGR